MDFVQQLRIFVAVADNGSFARAAAALRMARPSVTNAVSALEASIGARLLQRTTRRSSLTAEGELFYERATQILTDVAGAQNLFGGSGQVPRGRLRVDIPVALAKPLIIPRLPEFTERYPDIEIILGVSDQPVDLVAEGVDCVVRLGELAASSMISRVVARVPMVSCAAPVYLAAHGVPKTMEDLSAHRAVTYFTGRGRSTIDWQLIANGEERSIRMRSAILVNDSEAFVACALAGLGLIQALRATVAEQLENGQLVEILPQVQTVQRAVSIMYPNRQYLAPQVRAFIDWISAVFKESDVHETPAGGIAVPLE
ncbi:LysR family transcriptional regulator [Rhodopseudomonas sp. BAL398]|nr:LysR family transcriptional regulator [Rhodopseudomonas sp. BAL398]MDF3808683.1 LysR family transcriptional regulator [Rhodopseudomonas sp. BAL398]WOK19566.1 LysR family transcriptional regulator [Rhodopseudomonas sp. BAL398]